MGCFLMVVGLTLPALTAQAETTKERGAEGIEYVVQAGDNVASIALKYAVDPEELQQWNSLEGLHVEPGQTLTVKPDRRRKKRGKALPAVHVVRRGDTFEGIARRYGVSISAVRRWNRRVNPRRLQLGQKVRLYLPGRDGRSVSYGRASGGKLYNGVAMESFEGSRVRNVSHAWGTARTVNMLRAAIADVKARWPDAPDLIVGHLSYKNGGRMRPHKSHQSGRDADASFYYKGNVQLGRFHGMTPRTFDAVKNWHLFKTLIDTGEVEYIFVRHDLQQVLYEYARSIGYTEEELAPLIQYPRSTGERVGIIRHTGGHDDHFHIRFKCRDDDRHCR